MTKKYGYLTCRDPRKNEFTAMIIMIDADKPFNLTRPDVDDVIALVQCDFEQYKLSTAIYKKDLLEPIDFIKTPEELAQDAYELSAEYDAGAYAKYKKKMDSDCGPLAGHQITFFKELSAH